MSAANGTAVQVWGGPECTFNRVEDEFHSQLDLTGHYLRAGDLDLIADLGIRTVRYPVLWEMVAPRDPSIMDWSWPDARLHRLRELSIDPIVGLVHHGSGPRYTSLLDPAFPQLLANYAAKVAERYPWVQSYTPVNEPLTTARFSGLYGLWYPHMRDGLSLARMLLNQCKATVLAMQAIRRVQPAAKLVQTDDLGEVSGIADLAYQADFENERRWLGWDLLCGRVDTGHSLWDYLLSLGIEPAELLWFREHRCRPDIVGINHYVTSNRFLHQDHDWSPGQGWGTNGRHRYADVEAARVMPEPPIGIAGLLEAAWERYRLPLAVTETHLGCSREEQLRWLLETWQGAVHCAAKGVAVRAVCVWSLFGSVDWDSLLTSFRGHYEPGAFDVRGPVPRPTALAKLTSALAQNREPSVKELLAVPGWWRRPVRLLPRLQPPRTRHHSSPEAGMLLIAGGFGRLGAAFARACSSRGIEHRRCTRAELDIESPASVASALQTLRPWGVVNAAGLGDIDTAEREPARCLRENATGALHLARACAARSIPVLVFSSSQVFDGELTRPYREPDRVQPLNMLGLSKALAERLLLRLHPRPLIVRTGMLFSAVEPDDFLTAALRALEQGSLVPFIDDMVVSPTYVPDLVDAALDLFIDGERGIWHIANGGELSCEEFMLRAARLAGLNTQYRAPAGTRRMGIAARRPYYSAMESDRGALLPSLDDALSRYIAEVRSTLSSVAA